MTPEPDRYLCPDKACKRWVAEHMHTGLLARHRPPHGDAWTLCLGSLTPLQGLPRQAARPAPDTRSTARSPGRSTQLRLFG